MLYILYEHGDIVSRSQNLAGIRKEVGRQQVRVVAIRQLLMGEGLLHIDFESGWTFETNFASFEVLMDTIRNWRNLYGASLRVNGKREGTVGYRNKALLIASKPSPRMLF